jgi:hypothetical protein
VIAAPRLLPVGHLPNPCSVASPPYPTPHHCSTPAASFKKRRPSLSPSFPSLHPILLRQRVTQHPTCSPFASHPLPIAGEPPSRRNHAKRHCQPPPSVSSVRAAFSSLHGPRLTFPLPLWCCRCFHRRLRSPEPSPPPERHSRHLLCPPHR